MSSSLTVDSLNIDIKYPNMFLRFGTKLLAITVLFLIFMGANVTSNNAGLAVPDWPTTYGQNMFAFPASLWVGGIFHEHVHRLIASLVGALTVIITALIWSYDDRRSVKILAGVGLFSVILQGVLGGLTVRYLLPAWLSSMHGTLGQIFFCIAVALAYYQSHECAERQMNKTCSELHFKWSKSLFVLIFAQLILANFVRHTDSGLAVMDFPTMAGSWIPSLSQGTLAILNADRYALNLPPVQEYQVLLHLLHRGMGVVLLIVATWFGMKTWNAPADSKIINNSRLLSTMLFVQFALGAVIILTVRAPFPTSIHVMTGALIIGLTTLLALRSAQ